MSYRVIRILMLVLNVFLIGCLLHTLWAMFLADPRTRPDELRVPIVNPIWPGPFDPEIRKPREYYDIIAGVLNWPEEQIDTGENEEKQQQPEQKEPSIDDRFEVIAVMVSDRHASCFLKRRIGQGGQLQLTARDEVDGFRLELIEASPGPIECYRLLFVEIADGSLHELLFETG